MTDPRRPYVIVDLDGTLTIDDPAVEYADKVLDERVGQAVSGARSAGFGVMVLTARGMRTWKGDRALVEEHVRPGVERWLAVRGVIADHVHVAKPWCGPGGYYVDDRNLHIEEFVFKFAGPLSGSPVAVCVARSRPLDSLDRSRLLRLERWLDVCTWKGVGDTDRSDGRSAALELKVHIGTTVPNVAGWFALHAESLPALPFQVAQGDSHWALCPLEDRAAQSSGTASGAASRPLG